MANVTLADTETVLVLTQRITDLQRERDDLLKFIRERVADRSTMMKGRGGYHARRVCLEAETLLSKFEASVTEPAE